MSVTFPLFFEVLSEKGKVSGPVRRTLGPGIVLALLSACAAPPPPAAIHDPDEARNREIHAFNVGLDKYFLRPVATGYGAAVPVPVQRGVSNFASNIDLPGDVLNNLLQGRPGFAVENTFRFAVNTTVGIGGLFDPATAIGVPQRKTDFGETLHVWGAGEGAYVELPALGPSTERDAVGTIVDYALNPVGWLLHEPESYVATAASVGSTLGDRSRYSATIDSVLYDSADSYAQTRLLYLQNRRFELGQSATNEDDFLDPYEDLDAE